MIEASEMNETSETSETRNIESEIFCCACGSTASLKRVPGSSTNGHEASICADCAASVVEAWAS